MGCCCSKKKADASNAQRSETEMTAQQAKSLSISKAMSSNKLKIVDGTSLITNTNGLALCGVSMEQDAAYWEWHIEANDDSQAGNTGTNATNPLLIWVGVATKKGPKFYKELDQTKSLPEEPNKEFGTEFMRSIPDIHVSHTKHVIGVAIQQSDLPMIQFLHNGEPCHELAINRFRGTVYPSIYITDSAGSAKVTVVFDESKFEYPAPNVKFGPVIVARGII